MNQPQDLYQEVIAGGDIKSFLLNLHRRNTGELHFLASIDQMLPLLHIGYILTSMVGGAYGLMV